MNRTTLQTLIGCPVALALGTSAAFVLPHFSDSPAPPSTSAVAPAPKLETQIEGPLAAAYRTATGAKRTLLLVSAAEHASAAEMSTLIRIARDDPAAIQMLAARWAELDPSAMFSSLYADYLLPNNTPGALPSLRTLSDVLFEEWAKNDLPAAIRALTDAPAFSARESLRMTLVRSAMQADVETGLRVMSEWGIRNYSPDMKGVAAWAARDPQHAAEAVLKFSSGYATQAALKQVGGEWGKSDPAGGLRYAATLDSQQRAMLAPEIMRAWAGSDLKGAAAFAAGQDAAFRNALAPGLVETWGKSDPAAALAWSQENLKGAPRTEAIAGVIKSAAEKSLTAASQLVSDMEPGAAQNRACASIFETWFAKGAGERDAAFEWLASLPDPNARTAALERVQWNWVFNDPAGVRYFISGPHGDLASPSMIAQVARNQAAKNPEPAMEWAGGLGANRAENARRAVLDSWLQIRPEAAADYARKLPAGQDRKLAIISVAQTLLWQSPEQASAFIRSLTADDQKGMRPIIDQPGLSEDKRKLLDDALKK